MRGLDLDGNEVVLEGDDLLGRMIQHEIDHLDGVLVLDRVDPDVRREALRELRTRAPPGDAPGRSAPRQLADGAPPCASSSSAPPTTRCPPLRALHGAGHDDRARGHAARPPPRARQRHRSEPGEGGRRWSSGSPVRTPERAREVTDEVAASGAEVGVVVAFGQLLPEALLDAVPLGFVNVHFSLLPRWRGAAPVERAILAGDAETGVCIMADREGPRHRRRVRACARRRSATTRPPASCARGSSTLGTDLLLDTLPQLSSITPGAAGRASPPTPTSSRSRSSSSTGRARPTSWCAWSARGQPAARARGRPSTASGSRSGARRVGRRRRRSCCLRSAARGPGAHDGSTDWIRGRTGRTVRARRVTHHPARRARRARPHRGRRVRARRRSRRCCATSRLDDRDRAFVTDLVYGTVRSQRRLDDLVDARARPADHAARPAGARRAAARCVPAPRRRPRARRGRRDGRRRSSPAHHARGLRQRRAAPASRRLGPPVAGARQRRGRALVPRLARRAPHRRARRATTRPRRAGRDERAARRSRCGSTRGARRRRGLGTSSRAPACRSSAGALVARRARRARHR